MTTFNEYMFYLFLLARPLLLSSSLLNYPYSTQSGSVNGRVPLASASPTKTLAKECKARGLLS